MLDSTRFLPLVVIVAGALLGIGLRGLRYRRRHGTSGFAFRGNVRASNFRILFALAGNLAQALVLAFAPGWLSAISLPHVFLQRGMLWTGAILCMVLMSLLLLAQEQMGASWRMGLDPDARPGLVTTGLFGVCRNPIYTLAILWFLSFCIMVPTWVSVLGLCFLTFTLWKLVAREEAYLLETYGGDYRAYIARVGRFLPRFD